MFVFDEEDEVVEAELFQADDSEFNTKVKESLREWIKIVAQMYPDDDRRMQDLESMTNIVTGDPSGIIIADASEVFKSKHDKR